MQHFVEVYWREFQILRFFSYANSAAALLCPAPLGCSPTGRLSWGRIVVIAHSCFRSSRAARNLADHRNKLSHPWPFCWGASSNETARPVKRESVIDCGVASRDNSGQGRAKSGIDARGGTRG